MLKTDLLRPSSLADSTDRAQIAELLTIGELAERARRAGVRVMAEGPGHIPLNEVRTNVQIQKKLTGHAPFCILGMLPVDTAARSRLPQSLQSLRRRLSFCGGFSRS